MRGIALHKKIVVADATNLPLNVGDRVRTCIKIAHRGRWLVSTGAHIHKVRCTKSGPVGGSVRVGGWMRWKEGQLCPMTRPLAHREDRG